MASHGKQHEIGCYRFKIFYVRSKILQEFWFSGSIIFLMKPFSYLWPGFHCCLFQSDPVLKVNTKYKTFWKVTWEKVQTCEPSLRTYIFYKRIETFLAKQQILRDDSFWKQTQTHFCLFICLEKILIWKWQAFHNRYF